MNSRAMGAGACLFLLQLHTLAADGQEVRAVMRFREGATLGYWVEITSGMMELPYNHRQEAGDEKEERTPE